MVGSVSLAGIRTLSANELLHPSANAEVVETLGRETFSPRTMELTADDGKQLSVPSDGWGQLLVYRKDLFDAAGLPAPDTYERIAAAAAKLNTGGVAGITAATAPGDVFTQQTFEHLALANNCQLTDDSGAVRLDSPECVEAFHFYGDLMRDNSVKGAPAQYGEISSWAVLDGAVADPAKSFVELMLGDGYPRWFGMSPEGRFPVRKGTAQDPEAFLTAWNTSQAGMDTTKALSEVYGEQVLTELRRSPDTFTRWGITQGQSKLVGAILGELPVPKALADVISGKSDAAAAAGRARKDVEAIKAGVN